MDSEAVIQIFCGEGKGKTSAAMGVAFKTIGDGTIVYVVRFDNGKLEKDILNMFEPEFKIFDFDVEMAFNFAKKAMSSKECDILIFDEILELLDEESDKEEQILELMDLQNKSQMTLILTGSHTTEEIEKRADYITELRKKK